LAAEFLYMLLHLVPFDGALWTSRYPELAARFGNWTNSSQPPLGATVPLGNSFTSNAVVNASLPHAWGCETCPLKANNSVPEWVQGIYPQGFNPNASSGARKTCPFLQHLRY
jgi:hypothetical protein